MIIIPINTSFGFEDNLFELDSDENFCHVKSYNQFCKEGKKIGVKYKEAQKRLAALEEAANDGKVEITKIIENAENAKKANFTNQTANINLNDPKYKALHGREAHAMRRAASEECMKKFKDHDVCQDGSNHITLKIVQQEIDAAEGCSGWGDSKRCRALKRLKNNLSKKQTEANRIAQEKLTKKSNELDIEKDKFIMDDIQGEIKTKLACQKYYTGAKGAEKGECKGDQIPKTTPGLAKAIKTIGKKGLLADLLFLKAKVISNEFFKDDVNKMKLLQKDLAKELDDTLFGEYVQGKLDKLKLEVEGAKISAEKLQAQICNKGDKIAACIAERLTISGEGLGNGIKIKSVVKDKEPTPAVRK